MSGGGRGKKARRRRAQGRESKSLQRRARGKGGADCGRVAHEQTRRDADSGIAHSRQWREGRDSDQAVRALCIK